MKGIPRLHIWSVTVILYGIKKKLEARDEGWNVMKGEKEGGDSESTWVSNTNQP